VLSGQPYSQMMYCVGKSPKYPFDRKLGGVQNRFELSYKIKVLVFAGIRFRCCLHVDTSLTVPFILSGNLTILFFMFELPCSVVAATAVFSTPDDGRRKRPQHVE
jgi:hypothetical protein